jgi:hypothetical protein
MKAVNITFKHGHIYNTDTKQRLIVEEDVNYILIFEKEEDIQIGKFDEPFELRTGGQIKASILSNPCVTHVKKIADKGTHFYFYISADDENDIEVENTNRINTKHSLFTITLLEDLFLYSSSDWKNQDLKDLGKLADCQCVMDKSEDYEMPFFEKIFAKSITSVVKKTHVHYFGNSGSPSKNAFDSVYLNKSKNKSNALEVLRGFTSEHKVVRDTPLFNGF